MNAVGPTWLALTCSETRRKYVHVGLCAASLRHIVSEQVSATHVYAGRISQPDPVTTTASEYSMPPL